MSITINGNFAKVQLDPANLPEEVEAQIRADICKKDKYFAGALSQEINTANTYAQNLKILNDLPAYAAPNFRTATSAIQVRPPCGAFLPLHLAKWLP